QRRKAHSLPVERRRRPSTVAVRAAAEGEASGEMARKIWRSKLAQYSSILPLAGTFPRVLTCGPSPVVATGPGTGRCSCRRQAQARRFPPSSLVESMRGRYVADRGSARKERGPAIHPPLSTRVDNLVCNSHLA